MSAAGWNYSSELFGEPRLGGTNISKDILVVSNVDPENSFPSFLLMVNHFVYPLILLHFPHCKIIPLGEAGGWEPTLIEHSQRVQEIDTFIPFLQLTKQTQMHTEGQNSDLCTPTACYFWNQQLEGLDCNQGSCNACEVRSKYTRFHFLISPQFPFF